MTQIDQRGQTVGTQYNADEIKIGVPFEQYKADLAEKEREIRDLLVSSTISEKEKNDLNTRLIGVERQRLDEQAGYKAHIEDLKERISRLDNLAGQIPDKMIEEAKQALANNDHGKANQLFTQVEEQADPHIAAAAEAAYQRGKLAEDAISYSEAIKHYHRATQLMPNNSAYLNNAGKMSGTLGNYDKAIEYFEHALASDLKTFGPDHPSVAIDRNNIGFAWNNKGDYDKAIEYYEQALASNLKTLGPDHPNVAIDRNNIGFAWNNKGDYDKAIEYYEQALASDLKTFGPDHPNVAVRINNIGMAWNNKGDYDKAIEYYVPALTIFENKLGHNHPSSNFTRKHLELAQKNSVTPSKL